MERMAEDRVTMGADAYGEEGRRGGRRGGRQEERKAGEEEDGRERRKIVYSRLCGRTGRSVGTTRNSTESGRSRVQSQVAAGAKYREFCFHPGRNPTVSHQKSADQNSTTMPTVERPSISSGFSQ